MPTVKSCEQIQCLFYLMQSICCSTNYHHKTYDLTAFRKAGIYQLDFSDTLHDQTLFTISDAVITKELQVLDTNLDTQARSFKGNRKGYGDR